MSFLDGTYIIAMLQLSDVEISVIMTLKNTSLTTIFLCSSHELMCCLDGMCIIAMLQLSDVELSMIMILKKLLVRVSLRIYLLLQDD